MCLSVLGARLLYRSVLTPFLPVTSADPTLRDQVFLSPCRFTHLEFTHSSLPNWKGVGKLTHPTSGLQAN